MMISNVNRIDYSQPNKMNQTHKVMNKAAQQLSSGKKINKAADNAAGLAIVQKMQAEVKALDAYSNNYKSKVNYNNVADGALSTISEAYEEMSANAIRALNGLMTEEDKDSVRSVNEALKGTVEQITSVATYNEAKVLAREDTSFDSFGLDKIKAAHEAVSAKQSDVGAETNALNHRINVNNITAENTVAAMSRIEDTQMEKAISAYKAQQTLSRFQTAMLTDRVNNASTSIFV